MRNRVILWKAERYVTSFYKQFSPSPSLPARAPPSPGCEAVDRCKGASSSWGIWKTSSASSSSQEPSEDGMGEVRDIESEIRSILSYQFPAPSQPICDPEAYSHHCRHPEGESTSTLPPKSGPSRRPDQTVNTFRILQTLWEEKGTHILK